MPKTFKKKNAKNKYKKRNSSLRGGIFKTIKNAYLRQSILSSFDTFPIFLDSKYIKFDSKYNFYEIYKLCIQNIGTVSRSLNSTLNKYGLGINDNVQVSINTNNVVDLQKSINDYINQIRIIKMINMDSSKVNTDTIVNAVSNLIPLLQKYQDVLTKNEPCIKNLYTSTESSIPVASIPVASAPVNTPPSSVTVAQPVTKSSIPVVMPSSVATPRSSSVTPTNNNNISASSSSARTNSQNSNPTKPNSSNSSRFFDGFVNTAALFGKSALGI
jgi:hypothetical protein